ncbi:hypothetical protein INR49_000456 [Caranx melampygus]|nr:hypothetical protein INR49_000456 [Caranx melampygus]
MLIATRKEQTQLRDIEGQRMVMCLEYCLEEAQWTHGPPTASLWSHFAHKRFWVSFLASLFLVITAISLSGDLELSQPHTRVVKRSNTDPCEALLDQKVDVDDKNNLVTISVISPAPHQAVVQFDIKNGVIVYKPAKQGGCFLEKMDQSDYANARFLRKGPSLMDLCRGRPIHWGRKTMEVKVKDTDSEAGGLTITPIHFHIGRLCIRIMIVIQISPPLRSPTYSRGSHYTGRTLVIFHTDMMWLSLQDQDRTDTSGSWNAHSHNQRQVFEVKQ